MSGGSRYVAGVILMLALVAGVGAGAAPHSIKTYPAPLALSASGLLGNQSAVRSVVPISPDEAREAAYLPASNVLRLSDGRLRYLPAGAYEPHTVPPGDPGAAASAAGTRAWLALGDVPGENDAERLVSERALLDLRLLTRPNGAAVAAWKPGWSYVWPRDASWISVAFTTTGHYEEARAILEFLAGVQNADGTWEARYRMSDGFPVDDGRTPQLDANGWFLWAVWYYSAAAPSDDREALRALWPDARRAADAAVASLGRDGLPPGGPDYWEISTRRPNLGTAAPLRTGLRAAADLARGRGYRSDARRYSAAAARLDAAIESEFAPHGYPRTTHPDSGVDAAVNFLAPPFAPPDPSVERAVEDAAERLAAPNGGVLPGEKWPQDPTVAWTPETAFFALSAAASGGEENADRWLAWLAEHRTNLGAFPEKVNGAGDPKTVAPLGWTSAIVVLALVAKEEPLPVPPPG